MKLLIASALFFSFLWNGSLFASEKVMFGIDVLESQEFLPLQGKRVGLITNHTGLNRKGKRTIDLLFNAKNVKLVSIFSPEHGVKGKAAHGIEISDSRDEKTRVPIYSLYGKQKRLTAEMLEGLDALVFDIQDIGTRFYTYTTTLAYAIEEAEKKNLEIFVLDRPNPITGTVVEGEPLEYGINHFTAYLRVPVRHGFTVGEVAHWYNRTSNLNARLTVIKMEGWKRNLWWDETKLKFARPSPNIRNLTGALLYCGIGALEATNVSVGRGTSTPFELFGAPWMDGILVAERLEFYSLPGFKFKPVRFKPKHDLYKEEECGGVKIIVTDRNTARPFDLFIYIATILRDSYPQAFTMRWEEIERVTGSKRTREMIQSGASAETILFLIHEKAAHFAETNTPYLLYK